MEYDCVVIGSGISGLTAALALQKQGRSVVVFEQQDHPGPLLARFQRGGRWFDGGLHYIGGILDDSPYLPYLRFLGIEALREKVQPMHPDGYDVLLGPRDEPIPFPSGWDRVRETLLRVSPGEEEAIDGYLKACMAMHRKNAFTNLDLEQGDEIDLSDHTESLQQRLTQLGMGADLQYILGNYGLILYGAPAAQCPFHLHALVMGSFYSSAGTLPKGGDTVLEVYRSALERAGIPIVTGWRVASIDCHGERRVRGVTVANKQGDTEKHDCKSVISTCHPDTLDALLEEAPLRPIYRRQLRTGEDTYTPFVVFLGVDSLPSWLHKTNYYYIGTPGVDEDLSCFYGLMNCDAGGEEGLRKGLCLMAQAPPPPGCAGWREARRSLRGAAPLSRTPEYEAYRQMAGEKLVSRMEAHFPELRGKTEILDVASPLTFQHYTLAPTGSIYGRMHSVHRRQLNPRGSLRGLYLCGQSVVAPGFIGAMVSGILAAGICTGWQALRNEVLEYR